MREWVNTVVGFVTGGGAVLVVVNFWLNHKLKSVVAERQERFDERVSEAMHVKEYRRAIGRLFFWINQKMTCCDTNGSLAKINTNLEKAHSDFEEADKKLKYFDDELVAKYKSKKG